MPATITSPTLLADLTRRGFTVRVVAGSISVIPGSGLTSTDRQAIRERRAELLALLSPAEPWDQRVALSADGLSPTPWSSGWA